MLNVQAKLNTAQWAFNVVGHWVPKVLLFLAKVFCLGYLLSIPANQNLKCVAALVALALPSSVDGNLEFISGLIRAIKGVMGNMQAQSEDDSSFITSFFSLTKGVLSGIFSTIDKQAFDDMHISSKKVKLITDYIRGATTIAEFFLKIVEKCMDLISNKILKHYGVVPWFLKEDKISPLIDRFLEIKEKRLDIMAGNNRHAAMTVNNLYKELIKIEAEFVKSKNFTKECSFKVMPYLRAMIRSLESIIAKIPSHLLDGKDMRRSKPFWIYIYGQPRIGKSALFQPYLINHLAMVMKLIDKYQDYTNYTYFRNCGDKYWEKYRPDAFPVLWIDDIFQNYADEQAMNDLISELTAIINDSMYALNMAFEDKHGVYFDSPLVISNAQEDIIGQSFVTGKCFSKGQHLYARRNIVVEFTLNPTYLHSSGVGINYELMNERMLIGPNVGSVSHPLFPRDMYSLVFHEPTTGNILQTLDFMSGINYIEKAALAHMKSQDVFKDKLYNHFREMWNVPIAQSGDNELYTDEAHWSLTKEVSTQTDAQLCFGCYKRVIASNMTHPCKYCGQSYVTSEYIEHFTVCKNKFERLEKIINSIQQRSFKAQCGDDNVACTGNCKKKNMVCDDSLLTVYDRMQNFQPYIESNVVKDWCDVTEIKETVNCDFVLKKTVHDSMMCVFCAKLVDYKSFDLHVRMCSKEHITRSLDSNYDEQWFDASDRVSIQQAIEDFSCAVMRHYPDLMHSPFIKFVDAAISARDETFLRTFQQANFQLTDSKQDQLLKITVILEMAALYNFEQYLVNEKYPTYWTKFKNSFKKIWFTFAEFYVNALNRHPILTWIITMVTYMSLYIAILYMTGNIVPIEPKAQTAEGDTKAKTKQISRIKKTNDKPKAQSYDEQNSVVETKLRSHMCKFTLVVRDEKDTQDIDVRHFGSGLCVGSDVFVLPLHFWLRWNEIRDFYGTHNHKVILRVLWDDLKVIEVPWDVIKSWQPNYKHTEDIVFLRFTKMVQLSHIAKFFVRVNDQPTLFETYLYGLRKEDFVYNTITVSNTEYATNITYVHEARIEPIYHGKFAERQVHIPLCYRYKNCFTVGGDCGLMLMHADSRMNCRKILGMHTAGNTKTGMGITSAIFCEDILEAMEELYHDETPITFETETVQICSGEIAQSSEYVQLEKTGVTILGQKNYFVDEQFDINKKFKITLPRKTKISKSVVHDIMEEDYGSSRVAPAKLKPFSYDGVAYSPLYQGLEKIPRCSNMVSLKEIYEVTQHMYDTISSWVTVYSEMRILDNAEMINGYGLLKPIDMTTSAGFPYVVIDNTNGKHPYFECIGGDPKQYAMKPMLDYYITKRENLAKQGIIMETFFLDTLKDEVRDLDKVIQGKTRIFQVAPMDFNILLRKYFGTFISMCHSTYLEGEMAVGINANSMEWTLMIKKLLENSDIFINGDGKNFDASLGQQYMMEVCEIINRLYNDGEVNALIRRVLFATFLNSRHIIGNLVYMSRQGNKSGIALTTIFNNLAGMFAIRLAFLRKYNSMYGFSRYISAKFYGDDDLISIKPSCLVDSIFYQAVWKDLGVEYTPADKGAILLPHYSLTEITFLQRNFMLDDMFNIYLPQLCFDTIMEIARWSESDPYNMFDQMNRFNSALLEMSNYGKEKFDDLRVHFQEYIKTLQEMGLAIKGEELFTYGYAKRLIFPEIYTQNPLSKEHRDLLVRIDKCEQMLMLRGGGSE